MTDRTAWIYILSNCRRGVLYVGSTTHLKQRIWQHKLGIGTGFAARHGLRRLVHLEAHHDILLAQARETAVKRWRRAWKFQLIEEQNPQWDDLFEQINT